MPAPLAFIPLPFTSVRGETPHSKIAITPNAPSSDVAIVRMPEDGEQPEGYTQSEGVGPLQDQEVKSDEALEGFKEEAEEQAREKLRREREARAQALTLEIVGDLPYAEVKPPENVLFVCKLNPVTEDEDLDTIFSRFGPIVSCEVIRDKRTHESLQYAFIEFENQKDCEQAYFKMQGVLIDDHRIHVDFSQSVSRLSDKWRTATNSKRAQSGGGFGGIATLEKKRQFRGVDPRGSNERKESSEHSMVFEKDKMRHGRDHDSGRHETTRRRSRSRSPRKHDRYRARTAPRDDRHRGSWNDDYRPDNRDDRSRRR